jgi:type IV secretory pathway VirB10-like protein
MRNNIITVAVYPNRDVVTSTPIYRPDYGQILKITNVDLPTAYQVFFSNSTAYSGTAKAMIGNADGVEIPTEFIATGQTVYAWLFLHTGDSDGEVTYRIIIPNVVTPEFTDEVPTPAQQSEIDQALIALNQAVTQTAADVEEATRQTEAAGEYAEAAGISASNASTSEANALESERAAKLAEQGATTAQSRAENARGAAQRYAQDAQDSADDAEQSAERAEQAATTAGYMDFEIVNGRVIYTRTDAVDVDFEIVDGHLIMEVA